MINGYVVVDLGIDFVIPDNIDESVPIPERVARTIRETNKLIILTGITIVLSESVKVTNIIVPAYKGGAIVDGTEGFFVKGLILDYELELQVTYVNGEYIGAAILTNT